MGLSCRLVCLFLVGILVLTGSQASASEVSESEALISRGLELRRAGEDAKALPLFQEAVEKKKTPRTLAQVGLCEFALGLWVEAEDHLQQALASKTDPWIRKNERLLKGSLDDIQEKLGSLEVWGEPTGARVAVDGHSVGSLPLQHPLRLAAGRHSLLIEATGFLSDTRYVQVSGQTVAREHAALAPVPVLTAPPEVTPSTSPTPTLVRRGAVTNGGPEGEPASDPIYTRWWFWTAIGVVALAAGGTVLLLSRKEGCQSSGGGSCVAW